MARGRNGHADDDDYDNDDDDNDDDEQGAAGDLVLSALDPLVQGRLHKVTWHGGLID